MARRRENMLEAFKASAERPPAQPRKGPAPRAAQGAAGSVPAHPGKPGKSAGVPPGAAQAPPGSARFEPAGLTLPIGPATFVLLQAVLLVAVFFMGRLSLGSRVLAGPEEGQSGDEVQLQNPSGSTRLASPGPGRRERNDGQARPGTAPNGGGTQLARNPADEAFLAAENKFTVLVCTYDDTEYGRDRAWAAFEHLQNEGFQAVTPRRQNGRLFLFVGASGSYKALESLEKDLKRAEGPGSQRQPFRDAFRVNIEDYL